MEARDAWDFVSIFETPDTTDRLCGGIQRSDFEEALDELFRDIELDSAPDIEEIENCIREIQKSVRKTRIYSTLSQIVFSKTQKDTYLKFGKLLISEKYLSVYFTPTTSTLFTTAVTKRKMQVRLDWKIVR